MLNFSMEDSINFPDIFPTTKIIRCCVRKQEKVNSKISLLCDVMIFIGYYTCLLKIQQNLSKEFTKTAWGRSLLSLEFMA